MGLLPILVSLLVAVFILDFSLRALGRFLDPVSLFVLASILVRRFLSESTVPNPNCSLPLRLVPKQKNALN